MMGSFYSRLCYAVSMVIYIHEEPKPLSSFATTINSVRETVRECIMCGTARLFAI